MIDPRAAIIAVDANALDENGTDQDHLARRFRLLVKTRTITVAAPAGVAAEVAHSRTPALVQDTLLPIKFGPRPAPNQAQQITRIRVRAILRGDAPMGKHDADAAHLCEAAEAGCAYFITRDKRILRKRPDLRSALPSLAIATLPAFFAIFDAFALEPPP